MKRRVIMGGERISTALIVAFLCTCGLLGGDSRSDFPGLLLLYPAVAVLAAGVLFVRDDSLALPLSLFEVALLALATIMAVQLIPLPPAIWESLPSRPDWSHGLGVLGIEPAWQPITVAPDLTLDSLASLVPPLGAILVLRKGTGTMCQAGVVTIIVIAMASAVMGIAQFVAGDGVAVSLYPSVRSGDAIGLFANRNHAALLLAVAVPLLFSLPTSLEWLRARGVFGMAGVTGVALFLCIALIFTQSRGGLVVGLLGLALSMVFIAPHSMKLAVPALSTPYLRVGVAGFFVAGAAALTVAAFVRPDVFQRVVFDDVPDELRLRVLPVLIDIVRAHGLFGTGFGTFDTVYRIYEPLALLQPEYLNHAHNDFVELAITGGAPALAVLALFVLWFVRGTLRIASQPPTSGRVLLARAAAIGIALIGVASFFDYALRTPLFAVILVSLCYLVERAAPGSAQEKALPKKPAPLERLRRDTASSADGASNNGAIHPLATEA